MAEHGIDAIDLHEVQQLAGARNRSAVQYHFENREGLVAAVLNPHRKLVNERRLRMLDRIVRTGDVTPQTLVDALIMPLAEHLKTSSGQNYILVCAADALLRLAAASRGDGSLHGRRPPLGRAGGAPAVRHCRGPQDADLYHRADPHGLPRRSRSRPEGRSDHLPAGPVSGKARPRLHGTADCSATQTGVFPLARTRSGQSRSTSGTSLGITSGGRRRRADRRPSQHRPSGFPGRGEESMSPPVVAVQSGRQVAAPQPRAAKAYRLFVVRGPT